MTDAPAPVPNGTPDAQALLAEIVERETALMRRAHEIAMAAEPKDFAEHSRTAHRAMRSLRQTLLLMERLKQIRADAGRRAVQAAVEARRAGPDIVALATGAQRPARPSAQERARRLGEVRTALTRLIWREVEVEHEREHMLRGLKDELRRIGLDASLALRPAEDHIVRLALQARLDPQAALRWRDLPPAPGEPDDPEAARSEGSTPGPTDTG